MDKMTGECTVDLFWGEVAHFGWGTKTTGYDAIKREMMERYDDVFLRSFHAVYDSFASMLYQRVDAWEKANEESCGCGDDGFGDLLSHVIGLGKDTYEEAMENPQSVVRRGQAGSYDEKFSYSFPYPAIAPRETLEVAQAKIRKEREERDCFDAEPVSEDSVLMEALHRTLGDQAEQDPRLYGARAREQKVQLEALMMSEFGSHFGADLPFVVGVFAEVAKDAPKRVLERDALKVVRALERIQEKREELLEDFQERAEVLDRFSYWGCRNMVTDIQDHFGEKE